MGIKKLDNGNILALETRDQPDPNPREVLIKTSAAGVNRPDVLQRLGYYPPPPGASDLLGLEVAGEISAVGSEVSEYSVGDKVCALVNGGGYAEYCLAPVGSCLPVPQNMSMVESAALPETFFTVWSNLFHQQRIAPGQTLLVHGGTSGIGMTALQLAQAFGIRGIATAGDDQKKAMCETFGASLAINYREQDFVEAVLEYTGGQGVNAVLDIVGGDYIAKNIDALAEEGIIVSIGFMGHVKATVNLMKLMKKRGFLTGSTLRARDNDYKATIAQELKQQVWPLIAADKIKVHIHQTFDFESAQAAHELMETNQHMGKIVLTFA